MKEKSSTSCDLAWREVPAAHKNGVIRNHHVVYWPESNPGDEKTSVTPNVLSATISGLRPRTKYLVKVAAFTIAHGNFSVPIECTTDDGGTVS